MTSVDRLIITASQLTLNTSDVELIKTLASEITDWEEFVKKTVLHRVASFVYYTLKHNGLLDVIPTEVAGKLHGHYLKSYLYNKSLFEEVGYLSDALKDYKVVLLKGVALNLDIYQDLGIRPMSDIDVMVYFDERLDIFNLFKKLKWVLSDDFVDKSEIHRKVSDVEHKHMPKLQRTKQSGFVELHWKFFAGEDDDALSKEAMDSATLYKDNLYLMSDEMMFAHLCSNFTDGYDMGESLRTVCDIHEFLLKKKLDWNKIDKICAHEPLHSRLLTALNCVEWLFGYEIPSRYKTDEFKDVDSSLDFLAEDKIPDRTIGKIRLIKEIYQKCGGVKNFAIFLFKSVFPDKEWLNVRAPKGSKYKLLAFWKSKIL